MSGRGRPAERRCFHQFHVLNILRSGARGDFVEPVAFVVFVCAVKSVERVEEMVVACRAGGGNKTAHRERVDQLVIEMLIFVGLGGGDVARFARRALCCVVGFVLRLGEGQRRRIDADRTDSRVREVRPSAGDKTCAGVGVGIAKRTSAMPAMVVRQRAMRFRRD